MGEGQRELLLQQGCHRGTEETPPPTRTAGDCPGLLTRLPAKPLSHFWVLAPLYLPAARSAGHGTALPLPFQHCPPLPLGLGTAHVGYQPSLSVSQDAGLSGPWPLYNQMVENVDSAWVCISVLLPTSQPGDCGQVMEALGG